MNAPFLRPAGCPAGVDPSDWRQALSDRIEQMAAAMTNLIDALDVMDGDPDFEPNSDELDLSTPEGGWWSFNTALLDDSEESDEGEDADPAEPMLGAPEQNPRTAYADQTQWAGGGNSFRSDEAEEENEHGSNILDVPHRWAPG